MRFFFEICAVLILGVSLGGVISWYSIQSNHGFGALTINQWTAWPLAGDKDADPYTTAKIASSGEVPLGAAEGIAFHQSTDSSGTNLRRNCQYRLSGQTPLARMWTLAAHGVNGKVVSTADDRASSLSSRSLIRNADGSFVITVGPTVSSGNWLEIAGSGQFQLILRLYDTQVTSSGGIANPDMPTVSLIGCQT